jgi:tetratricopeptide (TPR) repeat protein
MKLFAFSVLLYSFTTAYSQDFSEDEQFSIDSLNSIILGENSEDSAKVNSCFYLALYYYSTRPDTTIEICSFATQLAKEINYKSGMAEGYGWLGYLNFSLGNNDLALAYHFKSLDLRKGEPDSFDKAVVLNNIAGVYEIQGKIDLALNYYHQAIEIHLNAQDIAGTAILLNNIAGIYMNKGDIPKALEIFDKTVNLRKHTDDKEGLAYTYNNIGSIYESQGEFDQSIEYHEMALSLRREINDRYGEGMSLNNIGYVKIQEKKYDQAIKYLNLSLGIQEEIGDLGGQGYSLNNLAFASKQDGNIPEAIEYYQKALNIYRQIGDIEGESMVLTNLGTVEFQQGKFLPSKIHAERSFALSQSLGFPDNIQSSAELLSTIYEHESDGMKALDMYKLHIEMRDSLNNEATQKASAKLEAKYVYETKKAIDDVEHEKELSIEQEAKKKAEILKYAAFIGMILIAGFLFFVFNRLKITRRQKTVIEAQKTEVEQQKDKVERAHQELEEKNNEILDSIIYAKRIQSAILPPDHVIKQHLSDSFILYMPKDIVAGDFYWLEKKDGKVIFAAADCTGHGVPGAMVSVVCNNALNRSVREHGLTQPSEILDKTREIVITEFEKSDEEVQDGMDIALCSIEGNKLQYAGANNPLWVIRKNEIIEIKADKQPIGKYANSTPYSNHEVDLKQGDTIYLFSDGYVDQFGGEKGKKFRAKALRSLLIDIQKHPLEKQKEILTESFEKWRGSLEQVDDVCMIGVRI